MDSKETSGRVNDKGGNPTTGRKQRIMPTLDPGCINGVKQISETTSVFGQLGYGWRTQTFIPCGGRKDEQGFLNTRAALCLTPAFRRAIQQLRKRYPIGHWEQGRQADHDAQELCQKWQITDPEWILWLVRCWNPGETKSPPSLPTSIVEPRLAAKRKRLRRTSAFREDIKALQKRYPPTYWAKGHQLDSDAEQLCRRWGIDGLYWIVWLVEHWDPGKAKLPPFEPRDRLPAPVPVLGGWVLRVESVLDDTETGKAGKPLRATLTLDAGVSLREVQEAAKVALKALRPSRKVKGARPGLTEVERAMLRELFEKGGIPSNRGRTKRVREVADLMKQNGRLISESAIANELRKWLRQKGQPVKKYWPREI